jgi:hypothetical protein
LLAGDAVVVTVEPAVVRDRELIDPVAAAERRYRLEPINVMSGSGRRVFGPRRQSLNAMEMAGVTVAGTH